MHRQQRDPVRAFLVASHFQSLTRGRVGDELNDRVITFGACEPGTADG